MASFDKADIEKLIDGVLSWPATQDMLKSPKDEDRFDKYVDQILEGTPVVEGAVGEAIKRLTLNNVQQDASKLNTCMSYHVFAAAGTPTPRWAHDHA